MKNYNLQDISTREWKLYKDTIDNFVGYDKLLKDLVLLAGQGNLTISPFAKYTPQPASLKLNTHHSSISLVAAHGINLKINKKKGDRPLFLLNH